MKNPTQNTPSALDAYAIVHNDPSKIDLFSNLLANYLSEFVVLKDPEGRWIVANEYTLELYGLRDIPYQGKSNLEIMEFVDELYCNALSSCHDSDKLVWAAGHPMQFEEAVPQPDGTTVNLKLQKIPVYFSNGDRSRLIVIGKDVTEQVQTMDQLKGNEQRLNALVAKSTDVFAIVDVDSVLKYTSHAVDFVLGYKPEETEGTRIFDYVHEEDLPIATALYERVLTNPDRIHQEDLRIKHKNGDWILCEVVVRNLLDDPAIQGIVINYRDVTEKRQALRTIEYLAYHDDLTGLMNRRYFDEKLTELIQKSHDLQQQFVILYFDLDRFKYVNDTLGHVMGDKVILDVANRLNSCIRPDDVLARIGGDEFALLLPNSSLPSAIEFTESCMEQFAKPFLLEDLEVNMTCSIGLTVYPQDGTDKATLIKHADMALYQAKDQGKSRYQIFQLDMEDKTYKWFRMQQELQRAIPRNELEIYYQPKVHTLTGKIVGAEALVRWKSKELGLVSPAEFIPLAEETGMILPIGEWVLLTVCNQVRVWNNKQLPKIPISINVSGKQLMQPQFVESFLRTIGQLGVHGNQLELEITETAILKNTEAIQESLHALQRNGIKIAIDDFGIGYSSLAMLRQVRPDILKIDRSFIQHIQGSEEDRIITKAMIGLAHGLRQQVVAEGVEEEEQLAILKGLGCDQIQGFLYSCPLPEDQFEQLIANLQS